MKCGVCECYYFRYDDGISDQTVVYRKPKTENGEIWGPKSIPLIQRDGNYARKATRTGLSHVSNVEEPMGSGKMIVLGLAMTELEIGDDRGRGCGRLAVS